MLSFKDDNTLTIKAGTVIPVNGENVTIETDTDISVWTVNESAKTGGKDYYIFMNASKQFKVREADAWNDYLT